MKKKGFTVFSLSIIIKVVEGVIQFVCVQKFIHCIFWVTGLLHFEDCYATPSFEQKIEKEMVNFRSFIDFRS